MSGGWGIFELVALLCTMYVDVQDSWVKFKTPNNADNCDAANPPFMLPCYSQFLENPSKPWPYS